VQRNCKSRGIQFQLLKYLRAIFKENGSSDLEIEKGLVKQEELLACKIQFYGIEIFYTLQSY
jgi:hypothetical protein